MTTNNGDHMAPNHGRYTTTMINGKPYAHSGDETILDLVSARTGKALRADGRTIDGSPLGIAVAVDGAVIRRAQWATTPVRGTIDVVTAVQGG